MIRVVTEDGKFFEGRSRPAIIEQMAKACWHRPTVDEYMNEVAIRCADWDGAVVSTADPDEFFASLIAIGAIQMASRDRPIGREVDRDEFGRLQ